MAGMFGNKYDTRSEVNQGISDFGFKMGQMSQQKYAGMAAAEGMMGYMSGLGSPDNDPRMKKQSVIDELMLAHPNAKTPEELEALAMDLAARGLNDEAMKVREVAQEMRAQANLEKTNTDKANKPNKDLLDQIDTQLGASILTGEFVNSFMLFKNKGVAFNIGTVAEGGDLTQGAYDTKKAAAKKELQAQFKQFRNFMSRDKKMTINEINNLLSNTELLTTEFKKWAKTQGNDRARWLDENMSSANPRTNMTSTDDTVNSNLQDEQQSTTASNISPEELEDAEIQATAILTEKSSDAEQEQIFNDLQKIVDANYFQGDGALERALNPTQLIMYQRLQEKFGSKSSMNSSAFSNPDSQMWFKEMLGDVIV